MRFVLISFRAPGLVDAEVVAQNPGMTIAGRVLDTSDQVLPDFKTRAQSLSNG